MLTSEGKKQQAPDTQYSLIFVHFSLPSPLATGILIHGSIHSYVCCYLVVHYSFMISHNEVSIEHVILSVQILKAENSFTHPIQHIIAHCEVFQAFGPS